MTETSGLSRNETLARSALRAKADLSLVRDVLADREEAIDAFADKMRCVPRILAALNARMGRPLDDHDLADLSQDILMILWRKLDQYSGAAPLEGWVFHICRLELMNGVRRKRRTPRSTESLGDDEGEAVYVAAESTSELREELRRGIELLGSPTAEVIAMKHFAELTFDEIGQRMHMPANTAKTLYYRGLPRLEEYARERLGRAGG